MRIMSSIYLDEIDDGLAADEYLDLYLATLPKHQRTQVLDGPGNRAIFG